MSNLSSFVKRIRDVMRNDAGINGDAQRIEQIAWMLFLKVYDAKEEDWVTDEDGNPKAKCFTAQELIDSNYNFDVCGYPHEEEEILSVAETIQNYEEKRSKLNTDIDNLLAQITELHQKAPKGEL